MPSGWKSYEQFRPILYFYETFNCKNVSCLDLDVFRLDSKC